MQRLEFIKRAPRRQLSAELSAIHVAPEPVSALDIHVKITHPYGGWQVSCCLKRCGSGYFLTVLGLFYIWSVVVEVDSLDMAPLATYA